MDVSKTYLIFNFKTYPEAAGENAVQLTKIVLEAAQGSNTEVIVCPQAADIYRVREHFPNATIWAQHIDPITPGRNTGWTSVQDIVMAGANGTLINHSEKPMSAADIMQAVALAKSYKLTSALCVPDILSMDHMLDFKPDFLCYEPPSLVSTDTSAVEIMQKETQQFIEGIAGTGIVPILGAGIRDVNDVSKANSLGYRGVLVSSGLIQAEIRTVFVQNLLSGFAA
jgi:triosephosphate isomerase